MSLIEFKTAENNFFFHDVIDISCNELFEKKDQVLMIDVREVSEYHGDLGHVPQSQLIPLGQIPHKIVDLPKDKTIVIICRSGNRSAQAVSFMKRHGFESIYNMKGGMLEWNANQYEIEK